ncbi:hypothetical protein B0T17DRAFT_509376 [Bombardia bombarda]|uniref:Uncharacterized protein n=1 Tax=Bombardia bombarda TaxID=252184 RepID=A0AA40BXV9_9PEZI|nr:hypothetical protein B0T17DRAFT_509376 [Bombardia bombarda]
MEYNYPNLPPISVVSADTGNIDPALLLDSPASSCTDTPSSLTMEMDGFPIMDFSATMVAEPDLNFFDTPNFYAPFRHGPSHWEMHQVRLRKVLKARMYHLERLAEKMETIFNLYDRRILTSFTQMMNEGHIRFLQRFENQRVLGWMQFWLEYFQQMAYNPALVASLTEEERRALIHSLRAKEAMLKSNQYPPSFLPEWETMTQIVAADAMEARINELKAKFGELLKVIPPQ